MSLVRRATFFPNHRWLVIAGTAAALLRFLYLGDIPFLGDEARLIEQAIEQNASHQWTTHGLRGTRGIDYGPVPLLFYRAALSLTKSLVGIAALKITLTTAITCLALFWWIRLCPWVPPWIALVPLLSPYLWFYSRDLWDNSFNIPLSALLFVSYLAFVRDKRQVWLALSALCAVLALQVHLMVLPLVLALGVHAVRFERPWLKQHKGFVFGVAGGALLLTSPYLYHLATVPQSAGSPPLGPGLFHGFFGLLGGRLFTALGFEYFLGSFWFWDVPSWAMGLGTIAVAFTAFAAVPTFYGAYCATKEIRAHSGGLRYTCEWLALATVLFHIGMVTIQQLINHPHYYGGVWFAFLALFAVGASRLRSRSWQLAQQVYLLSLGMALLLAIAAQHQGAGIKQLHGGPGLARQMAEARAEHCSASTPQARVFQQLGVCP